MSKHYEERYYTRDDMQDEYDEHRRSNSRSRRRSTSRSRHRIPAAQEEHYYRRQMTRSNSGSSISSMSDYEYRAQAGGEKPMVRVPRDVIRAPTPPPVIQRVVERAPTPEPDIVERVIVRPQPQQLIERIIERPRTPPPKIIDKEICEPAPPPIVRTRIVKVDHSPRHYASNSRYAPRAGLSNYAPYVDYDYGYDNSYSTSYSTTELFQPSVVGYQGYGSGSVYPQAPPIHVTQMSYPAPQQAQPQPQIASNLAMASQASFANPPASYLASGYTYGYRPAGSQNYSQQQAPQMQLNAAYPRHY